MTRRVVVTKGRSMDREELVIIQVFEEEINKQQAKAMGILTKAHDVLIKRADRYEYR